MTLTLGSGPFGPRSLGEFNFERPAGHALYLEPYPRRIRARFGGETVLDTVGGSLLHETAHLPVLYVPDEDLNHDLLEATDHSTHCPFKGDATYRSVRAGDRTAENAIWHYPEPIDSAPDILGLAAVYWNAMDEWYEEDELVNGHLRDPYHRVDVRESSRHVTARANGAIVAETDRPRLLFETGLPVRYYVPWEDVQGDLLSPSETHTVCAYKGTASYWSVESPGGEPLADAAFGYPEPHGDALGIAGLVCFAGPGVEIEDELAERAESGATPAGAGAG